MTWLSYDQDLINEIAARLDLRDPNRAALMAVIQQISAEGFHEVVCDLATGVGKTYIMAALVDYLAALGVRNVLIVTPGKTIQGKTIENFTSGQRKYVPGLVASPRLITAETYRSAAVGDDLRDPAVVKLFVFNIQQMIAPSAGTSRRMRRLDELIGTDLHSYLRDAENLVIIADEHHVYREQARQFSAAVRGLQPRALVGLTATPDPRDEDKVIFRYTLGHAIADELVKVPVIVYRKDGHTEPRTQLADACHLLRVKAAAYEATMPPAGQEPVRPVLFVVCQTVQEAEEAAAVLAGPDMIGEPGAVLLITSQSSDEALAALAAVEDPGSRVRAVVSVDKLKEGWDVKNIGVIVALRALVSDTLTEQILGRGLRLPYGVRMHEPLIDQVDIVAHDSYRRLLAHKDSLIQRVVPGRPRAAGRTPESATADAQPEDTAFDVTEQATQGSIRWVTHVLPPGDATPREAVSLILQNFEDARQQPAEPTVLQRVLGAPQIKFPRRVRKVTPVQFSLSDVTSVQARAAGTAFADEISVPLVRVALNVRRTADGMSVRREAQQSETATQKWLPLSDVQRDLQRRVFDLGLVSKTEQELNAVIRIVEAFLQGAAAVPGTGARAAADREMDWSAERARQAAAGIEALVQQAYDNRRLRPTYESLAVILPAEPQPMPPDVHDRYDQFERGRWYQGWTKSVLPAASFDAATTEFRLAEIMDSSPAITWWLRLRTVDGAYIELDAGRKYYPDFIALDADGVYWIIEGKSDDEAGNHDAQTKKTAAEDHVRYVSDDSRFGTWRYLFCSEATIRNSDGSWDALVTIAGGRLGH